MARLFYSELGMATLTEAQQQRLKVLDTFECLDLLGWPLILIRPNSKAPFHAQWPNYTLTLEVLDKYLKLHSGYGLAVKLGGPTGIIDIEGDGPHAESEWERMTANIDIPKTVEWESERGRHRLFILPNKLRDRLGGGVIKAGELEIRLGGYPQYTHYSIIPPTGDRVWITK